MDDSNGVGKSAQDLCREDCSREYAKGFMVNLAADLKVSLIEKRDAGMSHSDETVQAMMKMLYGLHIIMAEQEFGQLMKVKLEGEA